MKYSELKKILNQLSIPKNGRAYIELVRESPPARAVEAGAFNVVDRIASRKMGMVIKSESRSAELPFLLACEFNPNILEFYDQPEPIKIRYRKADGKLRADWITNDFLIIKNNEIALIECKKEVELKALCAEKPEKYTFDAELKKYLCPPAIEAAKELGINHHISCDTDFTASCIRNCNFLFNFIDDEKIEKAEQEKINAYICAHGNRCRLSTLNKIFKQNTIIQSILNGAIFVDLDNQLLIQPDNAWVYHNYKCMQAYATLNKNHALIPLRNTSDLMNVNFVYIGTEKLQVISCDQDSLIAMGKHLLKFSKPEISNLIESENIYIEDIYAKTREEVLLVLDLYTHSEIEKAMEKNSALERQRKGEFTAISVSTLKRWKKQYTQSHLECGVGIFGLIEKTRKKGNRSPRLGKTNDELINNIIINVALTKKSPSLHACFIDYILECNKKSVIPCSMTTFYNRTKKISTYTFTQKREGVKAAYALGPRPHNHDPLHDAPPAGDFIFQLAHIDHTPLELEFISKITGQPFTIRLNLTILKDSYSLEILAIYLTFEKPSFRSSMMVLRECYRLHGVIPLWIMCDGGSDFKSTYFQETFASFGANIRYRPKGSYRHGSPIERTFGISEQQLIHNLQGNRKLKKYGRGQSPSHDSSKLAIWTPDEFLITLKEYAYETYPNISSGGIKESPRNRFNRSRSGFEEMPGIKIESASIFDFKTLPIYKVTLTLNKNQLTFQGILYRLTTSVQGYEFGKIKVEVKYDPYNCQNIYAKINDQWVKMFTQDEIVTACRDKGIILGFIEIYSRKIKHSREYRKGSKALLLSHQSIQEKEERLFSQKNAIFNHEALEPPDDATKNEQSIEIDLESLSVIPKQVN